MTEAPNPERDAPLPEADAAPVEWYRLSTDESLSAMRSSRAGLTREESGRRRKTYGANALDEAPVHSPWALFVGQFANSMILILLGVAIVSGAIGDFADTLVIVAILLMNAVIGFVQEYRAETALAALKAIAAPAATVMRGGAAHVEAAADLVPGDVVRVEAGAIVPADLRILAAASLRIDEAALTGESAPIDKVHVAIDAENVAIADRRNIAHKGTHVTYGHGLGVVIATGMRTEFGKIAQEVAAGRLKPEKVDEKVFARHLYVPEVGDADLIWRTSGEQRLSNFMLWQAAYSELVFTDVLWPDADRRDLWRACEIYASRDRRYGSA